MSDFNLSSIGESAILPIENLILLTSSLIWKKDDDLNVLIFYKTKEGKSGYVYSEELLNGFSGNVKEFPYISCGESGVDDLDPSVFFEKMLLSKIEDYSEIYFVIVNYAEFILSRNVVFNDYEGILKISVEYINEKNNYVVKISCEDLGEFLLLAKIEFINNMYFIKNENKVMTFKEFIDNIPDAYKFKR